MKDWISKLLGDTTNIYSASVPFYYSLKVFGLAPFKLNLQRKNLQTSCCEYFYIICFLSFYLTVAVYSLLRLKYQKSYALIDSGIYYQFIYQFFMMCFVVFWNFLKCHHIANVIDKLAEFDKIVAELKWKFKFSHSKNKLGIISLITASTVILLSIFYLATFLAVQNRTIIDYISFAISFYVSKALFMCIMQFTLCAYSVQARFDILNKNASFYLMSPNHGVLWHKSMLGNKTIVVKKLAYLHNLLQEAIKEMNESLSVEVFELKKLLNVFSKIISFKMVPIFLLTVISDVFTIYFFIFGLQSGTLNNINFISYSLFNLYHTLPIHFVIVLASKVATKSKDMAQVVGKIMNDCDDEKVLERVRSFYELN